MPSNEQVASYYAVSDLDRKIMDAARAAGMELDGLGVADLAAADEFHIGGRQATIELLDQLGLVPDMRLLDIGSGPGGASRFVASRYGCSVTGVDVTPEYIALATELVERMRLSERIDYQVADARELPFDAGIFDGAYMLHVGMNIEDKRGLCAEVARVLAPGGFFAVYDVMRIAEGALDLPVPWADSETISFLESPPDYRAGLETAGFRVDAVRPRREFAIEFFRQMQARMGVHGPPPLGLHLLMGDSFAQKISNMVSALNRGVIAPVEMIARLPS